MPTPIRTDRRDVGLDTVRPVHLHEVRPWREAEVAPHPEAPAPHPVVTPKPDGCAAPGHAGHRRRRASSTRSGRAWSRARRGPDSATKSPALAALAQFHAKRDRARSHRRRRARCVGYRVPAPRRSPPPPPRRRRRSGCRGTDAHASRVDLDTHPAEPRTPGGISTLAARLVHRAARVSITTTRRPASAARMATASPAGPPPTMA